MKPINSQYQIVKFWKFAEKLTATHMSFIILNVKYVSKKKNILGKQ